MLVVISRDILASARHRLSVFIPDVGTARLSECLAAGLGFKTNAGLIASAFSREGMQSLWSSLSTEAFRARLENISGREFDGAAVASWLETAFDEFRVRKMSKTFQGLFQVADGDGVKFYDGGRTFVFSKPDWSNMSPTENVMLLAQTFLGIPDDDMGTKLQAKLRTGPGKLPYRLIGAMQAKRDIDRLMCDFLTDLIIDECGAGWDGYHLSRNDDLPLWRYELVGFYLSRMIRFTRQLEISWNDADGVPDPVPFPHELGCRQQSSVLIDWEDPLFDNTAGSEYPRIESNILARQTMALFASGAPKQEIATFFDEADTKWMAEMKDHGGGHPHP